MAGVNGRCVVDTNVFLKLFFEEDGSEQAGLLFQRFESGGVKILVPDFLVVEFINILWVKLEQGETDHKYCREILEEFLELVSRLEVVNSVLLAEKILEASIRHSHAAYDMAFLVLADSLRASFVTADARLCRKLSRNSPAPIMLRDLN